MVGTLPPATPPTAPPATAGGTVPRPRRPLDASDQVRRWYENELGWPVVPGIPGAPVRLSLGLRFDVLDVPVEAGRAALRHLAPGSPVAAQNGRMRLLVAAGSADEVPAVLDWLEWGALPLDLTVLGEGSAMEAPAPPGTRAPAGTLQGAAVWLRPPEQGCEVEASLPTVSALGGDGGAPDLVRLLDTVATQCHRLRLRGCTRPPRPR